MEIYNNDDYTIEELDTNSVLSKTFFRMFLGLLASAIAAIYAYRSGLWITMIENGYFGMLAFIEIAVVLAFSLLFKKLSSTTVTVLFFVYAFLNGFTLSIIFAAYEMTSITYAFVGTAAVFGILAFIGAKTDKDLTNWGTMLSISLIVGLVLTFINMLLKNPVIDIALDWFILILFFGLTIYDTNKIKRMHEMGFVEDEKLYVYGAMELYLDVINIFLRILSIFGKRRK